MIKKLLFLILLMILLLPTIVYAEETFTEFYFHTRTDKSYLVNVVETETYYYSDNIVYENGKYKLTGTILNSSIDLFYRYGNNYFRDREVVYTCLSGEDISCQEAVAVFHKKIYGRTSFYKLGIKLEGGQMLDDRRKFYVGKDFEPKDGIYEMIDYEKHDVTELMDERTLSANYVGYFVCPNINETSCDDLQIIVGGGNYGNYVEDVENWNYLADGYQYIDGKYILINPKRTFIISNPGGNGYTCISKEDVCDEVYFVEISPYYEVHDGKEYVYTKVQHPSEPLINNVQLRKRSSMKLNNYFTSEELSNIIVTNPNVIEIENDEIICKEAGETSIIHENTTSYKELKINIEDEEEQVIENPKTGFKYIGFIGILLFTVVFIQMAKKRPNKNLI